MKTNIFRELLRYANYTKSKPEENILTGSFAFLLSEVEGLKVHFIKYLIERYKKEVNRRFKKPSELNLKTLEVNPQSSHFRHFEDENKEIKTSRDQIDIEIGDSEKKFGIFIENKLGAGIGYKQEVRYRQTLDKNYKKGILAFITLSGFAPIDKRIDHIQLSWANVYKVLQEYLRKEKGKINHYLIENFLDYMKEEGMAQFEGFTAQDVKGKTWADAFLLLSKIEFLFNRLRKRLKEELDYNVHSIERFDGHKYFYVIPAGIKGNKLKKWNRNGGRIDLGIYPYFEIIEKEDFDDIYEEGIYLYLSIGNIRSIPIKKQYTKILEKSGFILEENCWISKEKTLSKIIGKEKDPQKQEDKFIKFYIDNLKIIEKSKAFEQYIK